MKGKRYVAYHKLFEYLAADFGFTITAYVEPKPGIPPSAGYIERLIETIRETRPDGILTTPYLRPAGNGFPQPENGRLAPSSFPTTWGRCRAPRIGSPSWTRRFRRS